MIEKTAGRKSSETERKSNRCPIVDLKPLEVLSRIILLVLISPLLVSATSNLFAQVVEAKAPSVAIAESMDEVTTDSVSTGKSSVPDWVQQGSFREAGGADYVLVKANGLDLVGLDADMKRQMVTATNQYIDSQLELGASNYMYFDADDIAKKFAVAGNVYDESEAVSVGTGTIYTQYRQLRFDTTVRDQLASRWTEEKSKFRVIQMSLLGGGVVVVLSIAFLFFRINHATRGFYAGRLQLFAMAVILAVVISGIYAGSLLPWY